MPCQNEHMCKCGETDAKSAEIISLHAEITRLHAENAHLRTRVPQFCCPRCGNVDCGEPLTTPAVVQPTPSQPTWRCTVCKVKVRLEFVNCNTDSEDYIFCPACDFGRVWCPECENTGWVMLGGIGFRCVCRGKTDVCKVCKGTGRDSSEAVT